MILVLVTIVHVIVCLFLIAVVLLQSGASADLAGAFGGGLGSQTAFGPRAGANLLTKLTTWAAIIFMLTSFTLAISPPATAAAAAPCWITARACPPRTLLLLNRFL